MLQKLDYCNRIVNITLLRNDTAKVITIIQHIAGFVQERRNSSMLAMELHLSCTKPSI